MPPHDDSMSRILRMGHLSPEAAAELEKYRRNITVMFTDIKGSTAYFERYGDTAGTFMVHRCNGMLGDIAEQHQGQVIKTIGDAIMAAFEEVANGVAAAIAMQRAISAEEQRKPEDQRISIRIGLNHGPGIVKRNDVFGDVVNTASRVESNAAPEQIVVSDSVFQALATSARFRFRCLGRFELKGKAETQDLFEVLWNEQVVAAATTSHSLVAPDPAVALDLRYALHQLRSDGSVGITFPLPAGQTLIGRNNGDLVFPRDATMEARHAQLSLEAGQVFVESVNGAPVYFSLIGPYRLREGDEIRLGRQAFRFEANTSALSAASVNGLRIADLAKLLEKPAAEFIPLNHAVGSYLIKEEEVTWGRNRGTYVFPDDLSMSRSHAKVSHRGEDFFLEDTGSRNGTFVRVRERVQLPPGAVLLVGGQMLRLDLISVP